MANQKMGLADRIMLGKPKSDDYARSTLPTNRWSLFFDIFKGRFIKIIAVNLLILLFFIPLFVVLFLRSAALSSMGQSVPFSQVFTIGYQSLYSLAGYPESITLSMNISTLIFVPVASIIAGIGVAGGSYVMRNMVWTEGVFIANDFWHGIKTNFKHVVLISFLYSLLLYLAILCVTLFNELRVMGEMANGLSIFLQVFVIFFMAVMTIVALHAISMTVNYNLPFKHVVKNAILLTIALPIHNVFFLIVSALPIIVIYLGGFLSSLGYGLMMLFGFSYFMLVWTDYCQWAYDKFINDRVEGAEKNKGIYPKVSAQNSKTLEQYKKQIVLMGPSTLASRPIKPITDEELQLEELPVSFNRNDLRKLSESRQAIIDDSEKYVEEHKDDQRYVDYRNQFESLKQSVNDDDEEKQKRINKAREELNRQKNHFKSPKKKKKK